MIILNQKFFIKIKENSKKIRNNFPFNQWTAPLKPNYFKKRISDSDVFQKLHKITLSALNLVLKLQSYFKKKFKKNYYQKNF